MCNLIKNYKTLTIKKNKPKQVFVVLIKSKVKYLLIVITSFNTGRCLSSTKIFYVQMINGQCQGIRCQDICIL